MYVTDMTHISRYPMDKVVETELFRKFWHSLSSLRDMDSVSNFFSDFLSKSEQVMLAKRFAIAVLLRKGKSPKDIKSVLHVSDSSTSSVGAWLKNAKPKTLKTLDRVIAESVWEELVDKFDAVIDSLPPRYGSNWSRVGRERWERKLERASRQSLR